MKMITKQPNDKQKLSLIGLVLNETKPVGIEPDLEELDLYRTDQIHDKSRCLEIESHLAHNPKVSYMNMELQNGDESVKKHEAELACEAFEPVSANIAPLISHAEQPKTVEFSDSFELLAASDDENNFAIQGPSLRNQFSIETFHNNEDPDIVEVYVELIQEEAENYKDKTIIVQLDNKVLAEGDVDDGKLELSWNLHLSDYEGSNLGDKFRNLIKRIRIECKP